MTKTTVSPSQAYISPTSVAPVLIGFDGSDGGRDALELGRVLAAARGTRCLAAVPAEGAFADEARGVVGDPEMEIAVIGTRSPGEMLVDRAEREHAGSLVIGSPHRGAMGRALLGSVAGQALDSAPCEVVVAPAGYRLEEHAGIGKIAVAVNGSEESKVALTRAEDLAREAGATIEVIVAEDPEVSGLQAEFPLEAPPELAKVLEAAIASVDPALSPTGKKVDPGWRQVVHTIADSLAEACDPDVDLLVAGCRRPLARFLLGSVTKHLIAAAPCPVLVVPPSRRV